MSVELTLVTDVFESHSPYTYGHIQSNESVSKMNKVLGVLEGTFFMPNGISRNRRFYPESLWTKCLGKQSVNESLQAGTMLGMIEHPLVTSFESNGIPTTLHPQYSAIVTKELRIAESTNGRYGHGKAYVLDTPMGRLFDSIFSATDESGNLLVKPAISSRAFSRSVGKDSKGNDIMDENAYVLQSFDVTLNPGIPQATPNYRSLNINDRVRESVIEAVSDTASDLAKIQTEVGKFMTTESVRDKLIKELGLTSLV